MNNKREIIFDIPVTINGKYRVVCRFGYDNVVSLNWWGHLQKKVISKRLPWSKTSSSKWVEIDRCWWVKSPDNMDELKKKAMDFYDENVELKNRIIQKAMSL